MTEKTLTIGKFDKIDTAMRMLQEDHQTPRSIKEKLGLLRMYLIQPLDESTKVHTALSELEEFSMDVNIPSYVRTQLYMISGMLEQVNRD